MTKVKNNKEKVQELEQKFHNEVISGTNISDILLGLHNSLAHGALLDSANLCFSEQNLIKIFNNLDPLIKTIKKIEKNNE